MITVVIRFSLREAYEIVMFIFHQQAEPIIVLILKSFLPLPLTNFKYGRGPRSMCFIKC